MKRLLVLAVLAAACRTSPPPVAAPSPPLARKPAPASAPSESIEARARRITLWETGVRAFIEQQQPILRACYDDELARVESEAVRGAYLNGEPVPGLSGTVLLVVPIERDGAVRAPRLEENTLGNENVDACLLKEARRWNLPPPPVDEVVEIQVPLRFFLAGT